MLIGAIKGAIKKNPNKMPKMFASEGDEFYFADNIHDPKLKNVDVFIQTNLIKQKFYEKDRAEQYQYILDSNKPKLVMESPMFRSIEKGEKNQYYRLGWNSYQYHEADYNNTNSPGDRWEKLQRQHSISVKDWRTKGDYVLLLCQKEGDSSLNQLYEKYENYWDYIAEIIETIQKYTDRKIILRPHIRQITTGVKRAGYVAKCFKNVSVSENITFNMINGGEGLQKDFDDARCCVTFNSLSSVESVLEGIPTFSLDKGCMSYPVSNHDLSLIENPNLEIDRTQWLYNCAYTQWTGEELHNGTTWSHLKPRYEAWKK